MFGNKGGAKRFFFLNFLKSFLAWKISNLFLMPYAIFEIFGIPKLVLAWRLWCLSSWPKTLVPCYLKEAPIVDAPYCCLLIFVSPQELSLLSCLPPLILPLLWSIQEFKKRRSTSAFKDPCELALPRSLICIDLRVDDL